MSDLGQSQSAQSTNLICNLFVAKHYSIGEQYFLTEPFYGSMFKSVVFVNSAVKTPLWAYNP